LIPICRPPRPHDDAIDELAIAMVAIAVTAIRDWTTMDAVAVAIGDRATAMRDCPVAVRVIEGQEVGLGVAFTQPSDPFTSERRPGAAALQRDRITTKSHRCRVRCNSNLERCDSILERCDSILAPYDSILERRDGRSARHNG
jgi:hypothetical protein